MRHDNTLLYFKLALTTYQPLPSSENRSITQCHAREQYLISSFSAPFHPWQFYSPTARRYKTRARNFEGLRFMCLSRGIRTKVFRLGRATSRKPGCSARSRTCRYMCSVERARALAREQLAMGRRMVPRTGRGTRNGARGKKASKGDKETGPSAKDKGENETDKERERWK